MTSAATVVDNAFGCGTAADLAITSSNAQFCAQPEPMLDDFGLLSALRSPASSAIRRPSPSLATKPNTQMAKLSIADITNGGEGTATVTGFVRNNSAETHLYGAHLHPLPPTHPADDRGQCDQRRIEQSCRLHGGWNQHGRGNFLRDHSDRDHLVGHADSDPGGQHRDRRQRAGRPGQRHLLRRSDHRLNWRSPSTSRPRQSTLRNRLRRQSTQPD